MLDTTRAHRLNAEADEFWRAHHVEDVSAAAAAAAHLAAAGAHLEGLRYARAARYHCESLIGQIIAEARAAGRDWTEIAEMLGLDADTARSQYGDRVRAGDEGADA